MAHCVGITERAYQKIEQGKNKSITIDMISKIANALEVNWSELLDNNDKVTQVTGLGDNLNHSSKQYSNEMLAQEITHLKGKNKSHATEIANLKEIIALMKGKK